MKPWDMENRPICSASCGESPLTCKRRFRATLRHRLTLFVQPKHHRIERRLAASPGFHLSCFLP
jgi:hypothetical protein